jgi:hypothetical protein
VFDWVIERIVSEWEPMPQWVHQVLFDTTKSAFWEGYFWGSVMCLFWVVVIHVLFKWLTGRGVRDGQSAREFG